MPPRPRPTAAGLAAALGLPAPDAVPIAPASAPKVVPLPAEPGPIAAAPSPARRPGRMGGVVVPAAATASMAEAAPVEPPAPRRPPTTPRPVLLRRDDGELHDVPDEWMDGNSPYDGWYLTNEEMAALVVKAPADAMDLDQWPGCQSQIHPLQPLGSSPPCPYDVWFQAVGRRRALWEAANGPISDRIRPAR